MIHRPYPGHRSGAKKGKMSLKARHESFKEEEETEMNHISAFLKNTSTTVVSFCFARTSTTNSAIIGLKRVRLLIW